MNISPASVGILHFLGIGGIGMSGIAEVFHAYGYQVQGSDIAHSSNVERLEIQGIPVQIGHRLENIDQASAVVVSSAVDPENIELVAARARGLPIIGRGEMLAELMRGRLAVAVAGTHGKTTTTSMMATLMDVAELAPTVVNGGIINAYGTNAQVGSGDWIVAEADESDGSFLKLFPTVAIVTNIDAEHMVHYGSFEALKEAFSQFVEKIPFYGLGIVCYDNKVARTLSETIENRRILTYGFEEGADLQAEITAQTADGSTFNVRLSDRARSLLRAELAPSIGTLLKGLSLPMIGTHNVLNALSVIAVGLELGLDEATVRKGLAAFGGVKRRFTLVGEVESIKIIDDYAHHPVEISHVIKAARSVCEGQVIAVVQPHRYTRLQALFDDFSQAFKEADHVIVAPVHAAGEAPIQGINHETLGEQIRKAGHSSVQLVQSAEALPEAIQALAQAGDYVLYMGAGSITAWAQELPEKLRRLRLSSTADLKVMSH